MLKYIILIVFSILLLRIILRIINFKENFINFILKNKNSKNIPYPGKCYSCENGYNNDFKYLGGKSRCFDCEKQAGSRGNPTSCFSCNTIYV